MARNVLMVSIIDGKTHLLTLKRSVKIYHLSGPPIFDADRETIEDKCRNAHEIYLVSDFPSANYYWGDFPDVPLRHLKEVVIREASDKFGYVGPIRGVFREVGEVYQGGARKKLLSCIAVDIKEVFQLENEVFRHHSRKLIRIDTLPVVLASLVSRVENPGADFMVIDVGVSSTTIVISSSKGDVKVARQIPMGFAQGTDVNDAVRCKNFFHEIAKDATSTSLYYLQQFQGGECNLRYMLGTPELQRALELHGSDVPAVKFGLSKSPLSFMDSKQATSCAHLIGAFNCPKSYNLLSPQIQVARSLDRGYRFAMASIGAAIVGTGFYLYQIEPVGADKLAEYNAKNQQLAAIQQEVANLKKDVAMLNRFSGWETFYKNTYQNQPGWNVMFSDVAAHIPKEIVIEDVRIEPGRVKDERGKDVQGWNCVIAGVVKVDEWDKGLQKLREFGKSIHRSPHFRIQSVRYSPTLDKDNRPMAETSFSFQITAQLTPQDARQ